MSSTPEQFRGRNLSQPIKRTDPVWVGPESTADNGGITFSLLSRFLVCRERFRLLVVDGLKPKDTFNHRLEYGNMWHICEEAHAKSPRVDDEREPGDNDAIATGWVSGTLRAYAEFLCKKYPLQQDEIDKWYNVCKVQFPLYTMHWSLHPDVQHRTPLLQEHSFRVGYTLPSGRMVQLRGKWDSVDMIGGKCTCGADRTGPSAEAHDEDCLGKKPGIWLQENKTKGDISPDRMRRQLRYDLQTMLYLVALVEAENTGCSRIDDGLKTDILGVRYNVIRRPLSGGKGTIVRHKATANKAEESKASFFQRLATYIRNEPDTYFMRWNVEISQHDVRKFRKECLDPILEQLCDWWEGVKLYPKEPFINRQNFRMPYGVYNPLLEGNSTDLDNYLDSGSTVGLENSTNLFPELT